MSRKKLVDTINVGDSIRYLGHILEYVNSTVVVDERSAYDAMNFIRHPTGSRFQLKAVHFYQDIEDGLIEILPRIGP